MGSSWTACPPTEMRSLWRGLLNTFFWSYERGTWQYDLAVAAIVIFVLFSPFLIQFSDQPQSGPQTAQVELRSFDPATGMQTYRLDARLLNAPARTPAFNRELHDLLRKNVSVLQGRTFRIDHYEPVRAEDGTVAFYDVFVKP